MQKAAGNDFAAIFFWFCLLFENVFIFRYR